MVASCWALGCTERLVPGSSYTFHRIPRDRLRAQQWLKALGREDTEFSNLSHKKICSKHFTRECFSGWNERGISLCHDAVPTLFLGSRDKRRVTRTRILKKATPTREPEATRTRLSFNQLTEEHIKSSPRDALRAFRMAKAIVEKKASRIQKLERVSRLQWAKIQRYSTRVAEIPMRWTTIMGLERSEGKEICDQIMSTLLSDSNSEEQEEESEDESDSTKKKDSEESDETDSVKIKEEPVSDEDDSNEMDLTTNKKDSDEDDSNEMDSTTNKKDSDEDDSNEMDSTTNKTDFDEDAEGSDEMDSTTDKKDEDAEKSNQMDSTTNKKDEDAEKSNEMDSTTDKKDSVKDAEESSEMDSTTNKKDSESIEVGSVKIKEEPVSDEDDCERSGLMGKDEWGKTLGVCSPPPGPSEEAILGLPLEKDIKVEKDETPTQMPVIKSVSTVPSIPTTSQRVQRPPLTSRIPSTNVFGGFRRFYVRKKDVSVQTDLKRSFSCLCYPLRPPERRSMCTQTEATDPRTSDLDTEPTTDVDEDMATFDGFGKCVANKLNEVSKMQAVHLQNLFGTLLYKVQNGFIKMDPKKEDL